MYPEVKIFINIEEVLGWSVSARTVLDQVYEEAWYQVPEGFQDEYGNDHECDYEIDGQLIEVVFRGVRSGTGLAS